MSDPLDALTRTQRTYLALVSLGLTSKEIARLVERESTAVDSALKRAGSTTGIRSRTELARCFAEREPELVQSAVQRFGLSAKRLADLHSAPTDDPVAPIARPERQWGDLPIWQRRALVSLVAFATLLICTMLIALSHGLLVGASHLLT